MSERHAKTLIAWVLGLASFGSFAAVEKLVGTDWVWFTDYAYWSSDWSLDAQAGCELEVGAGMKIGGKPRGTVRRFSGHIALTTWGLGALHVRAVAGRAPCLVSLTQGTASAIPVFGDPSVRQGVIRDGQIIYETITRDAMQHEFGKPDGKK